MISSAIVLKGCTDSHYAGLSFDSRTRAFLLGVRLMSEKQQQARYVFSNFRTISVYHLSIVPQLANAFSPYSKDLYGCHAPLSQKRAGRNFHMRTHGYHVGAPELRELLEWCPKDGIQIFPGILPWGKE
jgi:hypothetical protein